MGKEEIQLFKKSINESAFSPEQIAMIWEFYVTKSIAASASQKRTAKDYGLRSFPWKEMCRVAELDENHVKILLANSMNKTLEKMDLVIEKGKKEEKQHVKVDIDTPRIVCLSPFTIADDDAPKSKVGEAESVLTHIRNSFAHGNTYYFNNNNVLFEDKDLRGTVTARILLKQQVLIDWIRIIDFESRYYKIVDTYQENKE